MISQPLDIAPIASNPCNLAMSPHTGQGYLGTCHTVITMEREKKKGGSGWEAEIKKSTNAEKQLLKEKTKAAQHSSQGGSNYMLH